MAEQTGIEWCDSTFNPWIGCTKVSPACDDCYAARSTPARALGVVWGAHEQRRRTSASTWALPRRWEAQAAQFQAAHGHRRRVFCASLADVFDNQVPSEWRKDLFELIRTTPQLDWLLLTKRPQNIVRMVREHGSIAGNGMRYLPDNVRLGTTVEDQARADQNIPALLRTIGEIGARSLFLSVEPMLGPVNIFSDITGELLHPSGNDYEPGRIDWVICGGESGAKARPMHPDWARSLRDQCMGAGVPFLFKQWGEWSPAWGKPSGTPGRYAIATKVLHSSSFWPGTVIEVDSYPRQFSLFGGAQVFERVGKKAAGRHLDGVMHDGFPLPHRSKACT